MTTQMSHYDIAIVGAGIAGAAMAAYLGKHHIKVALIEKDWREQDRIIGELLQPGGVEQLKNLGLEDCLEGIDAQEILGYAIFNHDEHFNVAYPVDAQQMSLTGRGFHNGKFLQQLRHAARQQTFVDCIHGEVKKLITEQDTIIGVEVQLHTQEENLIIHAQLTIVCDGIFSNFRTELMCAEKRVNGFFLGLLLEHCSLPFPNHGHVFTGGASPFLAYPVSSTEVRMLIDFPGQAAPRKGSELQCFLLDKILPELPQQMRQPFCTAVAKARFKIMPNHYMPANPKPTRGAVLIGDALNMRHPLTGGGMTVGLTDVAMLGERLVAYFHQGINSKFLLSKAVNDFYATRHQKDATINILANALYGVFTNPLLSQSCFKYLKKGGKMAAEPVALLSAISRNKNMLIRHFFAVAISGAENNLKTQPAISGLKTSYSMVKDAVKIISPLLLNEHPGRLEKAALWLGKKVFA